jgi:cytochrome c-type biogenesis protein CcmF
VVHLAVVVLALGITGSSFFEIQKDVSLAPGESAEVGAYTIEYISSSFEEKTDRTEGLAEVRVYRDGNFLGTYYPRRDFYPSFNMASTQAAIRSTPVEDLYIVPGEFLDDGRAIFRVMVNPMVWWMWLAGPIMILGTLIALWPQRLLSERVLLTREGVPDHSVV